MLKPLIACAAALIAGHACADQVQIAVAANFAPPMQKIAAQFQKESGHQAVVAVGATGNFYAQIKNGAPFEVMLGADEETPARLAREGHAVAASRFTYAIGKLVLWSAAPGLVDDKGAVLKSGNFARLAIANPRLAPYGAAALETLKALGLHDAVQPKLVQAENIAQAFQFVATGNAPLGFVALSQVTEDGKLRPGSAWIVPANLYTPIRQDAIVLEKGRGKAAAEAFMRYLKSEPARQIMRQYGYAF